MEALFGLLFGLLGLAYLIWTLAAPFVVLGLSTRVTDLERALKSLRREMADGSTRGPRLDIPAPAGPTIGPANPDATLPDAEAPDREIMPQPRPSSPVPPSRPVPKYPVRRSFPTPQKRFADPAPVVFSAPDTPPAGRQIAPPPAVAPPAQPQTANSADEPSTLEEILAGKWLTWVGALAVIIGAGFGFKYAIENNWVGPRERVLVGIVTGLACFAAGAQAIRRNYVFLAQGLTGSALGILYLSLYAAFGWYGILSYEAAFVGMIMTTTLGLSFAGYYNVQPTAVLGLLGGFLTPAMLWPAHDPMWTLFPYLLMLDLGVLLIAGVRRWAGLEILAFCGTILIWFNWEHQFFIEELLPETAGFMTSFLVLFALLSIWHNVIRKRPAMAGDFFLIIATPVVYFGALYALTFERYPQLQGEFSLAMMAFYALLAGLAAIWHPAGKSVISALAGLAGTFLILAVPLELTGHWVTICWIAQAVLLVELGLYFREKALVWTGLSLLAKVQVILLIYFLGTLADPVHFQTAFVRIQLHLIGRPETPIDAADSWMSLINGRSLSYLADILAFAVLAWEMGRRRTDTALMSELVPGRGACQLWMNLTVPSMALAMIVLETFVWATVWRWDVATLVSAWTIWTALFACSLILWSRIFWTRGIEGLGWLLFGLLTLFVGYSTLETLDVTLAGMIQTQPTEAWWLINPRGIGFFTVIIAGGIVALTYSFFPPRHIDPDRGAPAITSEFLTELFGSAAFALGLGMVLLETRVWAVHHHWLDSTSLSAYATSSAVFLLGAVCWRVWRSVASVERIVWATFSVLCAFLVTDAFVILNTIRPTFVADAAAAWNLWLLNPRCCGYLTAIIASALGALLYSKTSSIQSRTDRSEQGRMLGIGAYVMALAIVMLETAAWGYPRGWLIGTLFSGNAIWISLFLIGLLGWSAWRRTTPPSGLLGTLIAGLLLTLLIIGMGSVFSVTQVHPVSQRAFRLAMEEWGLNPRFLAFLISAVLSGMSAVICCRYDDARVNVRNAIPAASLSQPIDLCGLFAIIAYLSGLAMFSLEVFVQGTSQEWGTATSLGVTLVWTTYATLTLIAGIYWRSSWVRILSLTLFVITIGKVFLVDVWHLDTVIRVFAFISLGVALLLVSFLYRRYRERIRYWIIPPTELGMQPSSNTETNQLNQN